MNINFEDYDKSFKTKFLKGVESNINILKNLYEEIIVCSKGIVFSLDSKIENGRVFCHSSLQNIFLIPEDSVLRLNSKSITDCLKAGKTKILGCYIDENENLIFRTTECDYTIGYYEKNKKLNLSFINDIMDNVNYRCNLNDLLDRFNNKEFINTRRDKYDLIITHKLFPMINKCTNFDLYVKENDDNTFYGVFRNMIEDRNKKDEITFEMSVFYIYRFMDLN